jgi:hypothetical protein
MSPEIDRPDIALKQFIEAPLSVYRLLSRDL